MAFTSLLYDLFRRPATSVEKPGRRKLEAIWDDEKDQWKATVRMYSKLRLYQPSLEPGTLWPWSFAHKNMRYLEQCVQMLRLLTGYHRMAEMARAQGVQSRTCPMCNAYYTRNQVEHVLFDCRSTDTLRQRIWEEVRLAMPPATYRDVLAMSSRNKAIYFLSGLQLYVHNDFYFVNMLYPP